MGTIGRPCPHLSLEFWLISRPPNPPGLQDLFFFHQLSPGSGFFGAHGARIYNKLVEFIRKQYWVRDYTEVISPNVFNLDLWHISGHAEHYKVRGELGGDVRGS